MDLHAAQIQGYFNIPVDHLLGSPILANYFIDKGLEDQDDVVVVSPDLEVLQELENLQISYMHQ